MPFPPPKPFPALTPWFLRTAVRNSSMATSSKVAFREYSDPFGASLPAKVVYWPVPENMISFGTSSAP
jgi:hypothetical protein